MILEDIYNLIEENTDPLTAATKSAKRWRNAALGTLGAAALGGVAYAADKYYNSPDKVIARKVASRDAAQSTVNASNKFLKDARQKLQTAANAIPVPSDEVKEKVTSTANSAKDTISSAANSAKDTVSSAANKTNDAIDRAKEALTKVRAPTQNELIAAGTAGLGGAAAYHYATRKPQVQPMNYN